MWVVVDGCVGVGVGGCGWVCYVRIHGVGVGAIYTEY